MGGRHVDLPISLFAANSVRNCSGKKLASGRFLVFASPMRRFKEVVYRVANAALIGSLEWLQRKGNSPTMYRVSAHGAAALFEGSWFTYRPGDFGATGNIDYVPEAENATRLKLFSMLRGDEVLYDIGAHGGVYTITLRKRFPNLRVISFEPQPDDLRLNLDLNELSADDLHEVALGAENGVVRMTVNKRSSNHIAADGQRSVRLVRLDDLRRESHLPPPTWIKIDVEGFELPALEGARATLEESKPVIICEINEISGRFGTKVSDLVTYLGKLGYTMCRLTDGRFEIVDKYSQFADLGYSADWNYWFLPHPVGTWADCK